MTKQKNPSSAYQAFLASMHITQDDWRDGNGYDLDALKEITDAERTETVAMLADRLRTHPDWREIEALAAIGSPAAIDAIRQAVKSSDLKLRLRAAEELAEMGEPVALEGAIIDALRGTGLSNGLSQAIDAAEEHPSPRIQEALLDLALKGTEEQRIHCAALALYLGGKADEAFDWDHRPFFLSFGDDSRQTQIAAYQELCARLGVTPKAE